MSLYLPCISMYFSYWDLLGQRSREAATCDSRPSPGDDPHATATLVTRRQKCGAKFIQLQLYHRNFIDWLVVWNMNFIFPYFGNNHPNWRQLTNNFQRGWNHQPVDINTSCIHTGNYIIYILSVHVWLESSSRSVLASFRGLLGLMLKSIAAWKVGSFQWENVVGNGFGEVKNDEIMILIGHSHDIVVGNALDMIDKSTRNPFQIRAFLWVQSFCLTQILTQRVSPSFAVSHGIFEISG